MAYINPNQNRLIHALLNELGMREQKAALVLVHTNGRTDKSSEMGVEEAQSLINTLNAKKSTIVWTKAKEISEKSADRQRKKVLAICYQLGWTIDGKLDWDKINAFCEKRGTLKKKLNEYTATELPKLISQFEKLKQYDSKKKPEEGQNNPKTPPNTDAISDAV